MSENVVFPQNPNEWRKAISKNIDITVDEGKVYYVNNTFPYDDLIAWFERDFSVDNGYSSDFIPALSRNKRGLIAWVYGDCDEPYWNGNDEE